MQIFNDFGVYWQMVTCRCTLTSPSLAVHPLPSSLRSVTLCCLQSNTIPQQGRLSDLVVKFSRKSLVSLASAAVIQQRWSDPMLFLQALHTSCFPKYRHCPHSHKHNSHSSLSVHVLYLVLSAPTSKTWKTAKLSLSQIMSWQYWVLPFPQTPWVCTAQKAQILHVHAHIHILSLIHLIFTKASWYQADKQCKVKYFFPSPTRSEEARCCTVRLSYRKLHSNSLLSIHTFPWTAKSISIPLNTWLCTLVLNAAIYQLYFTARVLFAIHLLPENRGFCFPFPGGRPVAANATALFADSGDA